MTFRAVSLAVLAILSDQLSRSVAADPKWPAIGDNAEQTVGESTQIEDLVFSRPSTTEPATWEAALRIIGHPEDNELSWIRLDRDGTHTACRRVVVGSIEEQIRDLRAGDETMSTAEVARRIRVREDCTRCPALGRLGKRLERMKLPTLVAPWVVMDALGYYFSIRQWAGVDVRLRISGGDVNARGGDRHPLLEWGRDLRRTILECSAAADGKP